MAQRLVARLERFISDRSFEIGLAIVLAMLACFAFRFARSIGAF